MVLRRVRVALIFSLTSAAVVLTIAGCGGPAGNNDAAAPDALVGGARIQAIDLSDPVRPAVHDQPVVLSAARNEWTAFAVQVNDLAGGSTYTLRLRPLQRVSAHGAIPVEALEAYQILPLPIDVNRASYVRHTGLTPAAGSAAFLPRALGESIWQSD